MPNLVILGAQWGDEGKGKIVDLLSDRFDVVIRFQGGANAGHTVVVNGKQTILHQIPSGVLSNIAYNIIGNGTVLEPGTLLEEIEELRQNGISLEDRLFISDRAALVMPYHRMLDIWSEEKRAGTKIGTTGRGIGPAYADKYSREGLRAGDLLDESHMIELITARVTAVNEYAEKIYGKAPIKADDIIVNFKKFRSVLIPFIKNTHKLVHDLYESGSRILFEGAQGTMLDIDHGTYPFVTSSNTTVGGVCSGSGLPPKAIDRVWGILKAYCTRVGEGPFPTEDFGATGEAIREAGGEYGATTGRPRRCGWFDAVAARYAIRINGIDGVVLTKIDVLDGLDEIKVCTAYELDGRKIDYVPSSISEYSRCKPIYETVEGWKGEQTGGATEFEELPDNAKRYVEYLSRITGVNAVIISTGKDRNSTIVREQIN